MLVLLSAGKLAAVWAGSCGAVLQFTGHQRSMLRVNLLTLWRRLRSIRDQSRLLTGVIFLFLVGYFALAYWLFFAGLRFIARLRSR